MRCTCGHLEKFHVPICTWRFILSDDKCDCKMFVVVGESESVAEEETQSEESQIQELMMNK